MGSGTRSCLGGHSHSFFHEKFLNIFENYSAMSSYLDSFPRKKFCTLSYFSRETIKVLCKVQFPKSHFYLHQLNKFNQYQLRIYSFSCAPSYFLSRHKKTFVHLVCFKIYIFFELCCFNGCVVSQVV